ncbi:CaiB/BaiF CoA-transferase family protein [Actinomycetospora sp.]|jgi:CoA:oxalate CoA-transferase|uniref:CaiB/BaiF CoA transferase family protein n=1 Tax=Actinomycetospora sp. TaxID=1872135 RepID=UPI002F40C4D1
MSPTALPRPLEGLRVLDLSRAISGPYVGRLLADLGAEVVKIEVPDTDITQKFGRRRHGHAGLYVQYNAGKRSVGIDLASEQGAEVLRGLAGAADVVVENFRPGVLDRLHVGYTDLSARNPGLIMLSVSGFGQWGPESGRQAYAPVVHAESGMLGRQAEADGTAPVDLTMALADSTTALHGTVAVLAAVILRGRTGQGQHLDISMLEAMLASDDNVSYALEGDEFWPARGQIVEVAGGPMLISADPKFLWSRLRAAGHVADPDPDAPTAQRIAARAEVMEVWLSSFGSRSEVIAALEEARVAWAEVRTPRTVTDSPSVQARGVVAQVDDRDGGTRPVIRTPYRFSAAESGPAAGAPHLGEHNAEVLESWVGMSEERVRALEADGTLYRTATPVGGETH